ncbi:MAG: class I SAM-dependent methyltransferase [Nitrospirota bacterium]
MSLRYDFPVENASRVSVYSRIISLIPAGSRVLDVGCDTGNLGMAIKARGSSVDGIEMDHEAAEEAAKKLDRVTCGSIEEEGINFNGPYDYIVFADVLEHLVHPEAVLERIKPLLKKKGMVIASLPNVANFRVRLGLLAGRFEYTETGILDRTHLRFFTRKTGERLFIKSGYRLLGSKPAATHIPKIALGLWPEFLATRFVILAEAES